MHMTLRSVDTHEATESPGIKQMQIHAAGGKPCIDPIYHHRLQYFIAHDDLRVYNKRLARSQSRHMPR